MHADISESEQWEPMSHLYSHLFKVSHLFSSDNHVPSIAELINICGTQEISIDHVSSSQDPVMGSTVPNPSTSTDQEALLSTSSANVFLHFVLNGGGGYLDPEVEAEVIAATEALANVDVSWFEHLRTLRDNDRNTRTCLDKE